MQSFKRSAMCFAVFLIAVGGYFLGGCAPEEPSTRVETPAETAVDLTMAERAEPVREEVPIPSADPITQERTLYDFERGNLSGWEIPQWARAQRDYVAINAEVSDEAASSGEHSMKVSADFPGGLWTAALVEIQQYLDLSAYRVIRADVYLPEDAPMGLNVSLILTVGEDWRFVEMNRSFPLIPGEWVTITANIEPGSYDWKRIVPDEKFAQDVRKIAVRVESNNRPAYTGDLFIDNVRAGR